MRRHVKMFSEGHGGFFFFSPAKLRFFYQLKNQALVVVPALVRVYSCTDVIFHKPVHGLREHGVCVCVVADG